MRSPKLVTEKSLLLFFVAVVLLSSWIITPPAFCKNPESGQPVSGIRPFHFPSISPTHKHMRLLLENAFQYVDPAHRIVDPVSGYPAEGWNQEPQNGLFLRSFTQLTAVGMWVELLSNVIAGYADNPYLARESALSSLSLTVKSLLEDQRNPSLAAKGLLVNFLGLEGGKRTGPLLEMIERKKLLDTFGDSTGHGIWRALVQKGWLLEEDNGRKGRIRRTDKYGAAFFDGALAPYAHDSLKSRIMDLLDQRVVTIIFGDNANLTASLARSVGALLRPDIKNDPEIVALRDEMERFIDLQKDGYSHLFDPKTGTFFFGWDATADRFVGWDDGRENWIFGRMNYFVNEFRGPWIFAVLRYGLSEASIRNAGFKIKPYTYADGRATHAIAAWEGSAFQLLGLSLFMQEFRNPGWRESLETLVDIELDFSRKRSLPGFLSEAYSGNGSEYTGLIGISDLAVTDKPLIDYAPSLYTLGIAYAIAPQKIESFLEEHWLIISGLFTPHGPWEGWNASRNRIIPYQTSVHTLSLILGGIGSGQDNMRRYLEYKNLSGLLEALYAPGDRVNLLAAGNRLIVPGDRPISFSNGALVLKYRFHGDDAEARISFERAKDDPLPPPAIPIEIFTRFKHSAEKEETMEIVLPATPALRAIKKVSLSFVKQPPADLSITVFEFIPFESALEPAR